MGVQLDILGEASKAREGYVGIPPDFYVPVLKVKAGELSALRKLVERQPRPKLLPLLEPLPPDEDLGSAAYAESVVSRVRSAWGDRAGLLDPYYLSENLEGHLLEALVDLRLPVVLVLQADRSDSTIRRLAAAATDLDMGVAIRLRGDAASDLQAMTAALLRTRELSGHSPAAIDLVIDYGYVEPETFMRVARNLRRLLSALEPVDEWRSLVLSSSAFPTNLGQVGRYRLETIERLDWKLWAQLVRSRKGRIPSFSDYTIANPMAPPGGRQAPHNLRYTTEDEWIILKGERPKRDAVDADFLALMEDFAKSKQFAGQEFSWGDEFISSCARDGQLRGSATTWRTVGVSHHLETVLRQVRTI